MTTVLDSGPAIPDEIAQGVMLAESHTDEKVFYSAYKWLRQNKPVGLANLDGYDPIWLITKHADIMEVEKQPDLFTSGVENPILNDQASDAFIRSINNGTIRAIDMVVYMDPPEHTKMRNVTAQWFMPRNLRKFEDRIRELAREAVDKLMDSDGQVDIVTDFALRFPLHVIMTLLGVPEEDEPRMLKLTQELFGGNDPEQQREEVKLEPDVAARMWMGAVQDFYAYFSDLSEHRRSHPKDDLLSLIANAKVDGEYLSEVLCNGYYLAIATAGHDTTSSTISGALRAFAEFPDQLDKVHADPSLIPSLVDECIRWVAPVKHFMRAASRDTELRGQEIKSGDRLMLCYPSGNRDEDVFENPDVFDLTRRPNKHISFGYGPHMCLGQHVTKIEMRILFEELLPRLKSIQLAGDPKLSQANFVGGLTKLPVRFTKA
ncbi:cytochrome P450 [Candidatus Protofrankia californiensis]|uniref:cytochrome P450 n=1 Tax=Candidatus Protofrankia californiensis TaxID=1839754 RepID=UPI001F49D994|nr:cytochrome P450 [Candidatus Protofrankia californiensis]